MGLISKFKSYLSIMICLAVCVNSAGKSKLKLKLNALDNLFRSEMHLVNEKLDIGRKEREKLLKKFEETMGYLGDRGKTRSKKLPDSTLDEEQGKLITISNEIEKLSNKVERSTKDTGELSDSFIRLRRGVLEEKVARISFTDTLFQQLEEEQKNKNETIKNREGFVNNIYSIVCNQNEMKKSLNEIVNTINSVVSNQNDIFSKLDDIVTIQGDLINKVNEIASQDSVRKPEANVGCGEPVFMGYVFETTTSTEYRGSVSVSCVDGIFCGLGKMNATCLATGSWEQPVGCANPDDYKIGCYKDAMTRALSHRMNLEARAMTPAVCIKYCIYKRYAYAAVQHSYACFCGSADDNYDQYGAATNCNCTCNGDGNQVCGGGWANTVYNVSSCVT